MRIWTGIFLLWAVGAPAASAKDFYFAATETGGGAGTSCSTAMAVSWINSSANWGSGSKQINAGTTLHLCGTITGTAGEQLLSLNGSGTSTAPITIKFETGAVLQAPYWSPLGAISIKNLSYITVDGGSNGVIENTANGTDLKYKETSRPIYAANCTNCTVQNLTIANIYVRTSIADVGIDQTGVNCVYLVGSNSFTINHVTCHDAGWAFAGAGNNYTLEFSEAYNIDHGVAFGPGGTISGFSIHDNHIHDFVNWDSTQDAYHHDGIHMWGQNGGAVTNGSIFNNLFDGDSGVNITGDIYLQDSVRNVAVYNNVFIVPSNRTNNVIWFNGHTNMSQPLPGGEASGNSAYNNFVSAGGHGQGTAIYVNAEFNFTAINNVLMGGQSNITIANGGTRSSTGINHNIYEDLLADVGDRNGFGYLGTPYNDFSSWQKACGCDANSKMVPASQIKVGSQGQLLSGSVGIGAGLNLMSIASGDLAALASDIINAPRPGSGAWDAGAYQFGAVAAKPAAPTGLTATVQ